MADGKLVGDEANPAAAAAAEPKAMSD
jgi:hypothetical protein